MFYRRRIKDCLLGGKRRWAINGSGDQENGDQ
jgi:hypothetical protein